MYDEPVVNPWPNPSARFARLVLIVDQVMYQNYRRGRK